MRKCEQPQSVIMYNTDANLNHVKDCSTELCNNSQCFTYIATFSFLQVSILYYE